MFKASNEEGASDKRVNFDKFSWRPTDSEKAFLFELCGRYGCDSPTELMHLILADLKHWDIAGLGERNKKARYFGGIAAGQESTDEIDRIKSISWVGRKTKDVMTWVLDTLREQREMISYLEQSLNFSVQRIWGLQAQNQQLYEQNVSLASQINNIQASWFMIQQGLVTKSKNDDVLGFMAEGVEDIARFKDVMRSFNRAR